MVKIAHARIGSNGKISNDAIGDNNGKEVCITDWYNKPWGYVIRATNSQMALRIANAAKQICDINCGYDQKRRNDLLKDAEEVKMVFKNIKKPTSCDCSSFVTACVINAGVQKSKVYKGNNSMTTRNMKSTLEKTGDFDVIPVKSLKPEDLMLGDILLAEGSHTAIVVEAMKKSKENTNYYQKYEGNSVSVVDALKAVGEKDPSPARRAEIYIVNGLPSILGDFDGTREQNGAMLNRLKKGELLRP